MNDPHDSPTTSHPSMGINRRTGIALIPFVIAMSGLIAALILWFWPPLPKDLNAIVFGLVGAILVFDIPVCILVLLQWLVTGEPPELSLSPLIPSREEREFHRELRKRPKLNDNEFYNTYYSNSPIPKRLAIQLRASLENACGLDFGGLHPTDNLIYADAELDWADILFRINREFDVVVPEEVYDTLDGTFDSLLRCIATIKGHGEPFPENGT
jgi:hypothetical protein